MIKLLALLAIPASGVMCVLSSTQGQVYVGYAVIILLVGALLLKWAERRKTDRFHVDLLNK